MIEYKVCVIRAIRVCQVRMQLKPNITSYMIPHNIVAQLCLTYVKLHFGLTTIHNQSNDTNMI